MKLTTLAAVSALPFTLFLAPCASAEGLYYGLGLSVSDATSSATIFPGLDFSATDYGLALTLGYQMPASDALSWGIEGNLDLMSGRTLSSDVFPACVGASPVWCEIDTVLRLRGTLTTPLGNGSSLTAALGAVMVKGRAEDGPALVDTTGRGLSLGIGWQGAAMPVRIDVNYDAVDLDNANDYDRSLDMVGLRVSYMF